MGISPVKGIISNQFFYLGKYPIIYDTENQDIIAVTKISEGLYMRFSKICHSYPYNIVQYFGKF